MKQAQSETTERRSSSHWWAGEHSVLGNHHRTDRPAGPRMHEPAQARLGLVGLVTAVVTALWFLVTLPFRLVFWCIAWLGRFTAAVLGFALMVVGMALWAGPLFFIGIPLFIVGLFITLRCLD
jgi:hypothetical protein